MASIHSRIALSLSLGAALLLAACGGGSSAPAPAANAIAPPPAAAPGVMKIYEQTCHNCHSMPASGAPQAGDKNAWAPRIAQGREALLDHSINGYKSMPPMGTCTACTESDFTALIEYMSGSQLK
jgi:cytochrome c5